MRLVEVTFEQMWKKRAGLPRWCSGKESVSNAGDLRDADSIPGLERSLGVGSGNPLQYSYLEFSMDRGAWRATVHTVAKSQTGLSMHTRTHITSYKTWGEAWIEVWEVEVLLLRHWGASVHMRMNCCNPPGRSSRQGHRNECGWTGSLKTDSDIKTMKLQQGVVFYFACVFFFFKKRLNGSRRKKQGWRRLLQRSWATWPCMKNHLQPPSSSCLRMTDQHLKGDSQWILKKI